MSQYLQKTLLEVDLAKLKTILVNDVLHLVFKKSTKITLIC